MKEFINSPAIQQAVAAGIGVIFTTIAAALKRHFDLKKMRRTGKLKD